MKSQGEYCLKHSEVKVGDEEVFRKPALPLSASKPLKPSTTKIFSSSSTSRIANFSRSLENAPAVLCQSVSRRVPVRFEDYGDYFDVFFPLMILNTFETVSMCFNSIPFQTWKSLLLFPLLSVRVQGPSWTSL